MFELRNAEEVPTTLTIGDMLLYDQEYHTVMFCRDMKALYIRSRDDKQPLDLAGFGDFQALCRLVAHVSGIGVAKVYAKAQKNKIWKCTFGEPLPNPDPMPLRVGDVLRFESHTGTLEILRDGESLYTSSGEFFMDLRNFGSLCMVLASCSNLDAGTFELDPSDDRIGSMTLEAIPASV